MRLAPRADLHSWHPLPAYRLHVLIDRLPVDPGASVGLPALSLAYTLFLAQLVKGVIHVLVALAGSNGNRSRSAIICFPAVPGIGTSAVVVLEFHLFTYS